MTLVLILFNFTNTQQQEQFRAFRHDYIKNSVTMLSVLYIFSVVKVSTFLQDAPREAMNSAAK